MVSVARKLIKKLSRRGKKNKSKREETDSPTASEGNDEVINEISFEDEREERTIGRSSDDDAGPSAVNNLSDIVEELDDEVAQEDIVAEEKVDEIAEEKPLSPKSVSTSTEAEDRYADVNEQVEEEPAVTNVEEEPKVSEELKAQSAEVQHQMSSEMKIVHEQVGQTSPLCFCF